MTHLADELRDKKKIVFCAFSKKNFYYREHISKYVLQQGSVPLNPFMSFNYYLLDSLPRDTIRSANNNLVRLADELWVFGVVSDGVASEIRYAGLLNKPVYYFDLSQLPDKIVRVDKGKVVFEEEVSRKNLR